MSELELKMELEILLEEIKKLIIKKDKNEMSKKDKILLLEIQEKFAKSSKLLL